MIARLVLFGATGDLAGRFLLPALAQLSAAGQLPDDLQVVGAAQEEWDDATFRGHVAARLQEHAGDLSDEAQRALVDRLRYHAVDLDDPDDVARAVQAVGDGDRDAGASPVAVYLALPPALFPAAVTSLGAVGLPSGSRLAVEKPFGDDLGSAVALNAALAGVGGVTADSVVRVDHILGMPRVQDLRRLRGEGGALGHVWDGTHIGRVEILWEETLGLEGRASFYDRAGAVKDVLQNHMLQVLALVAMEPQVEPTEQGLHEAKADVLRSVRVLSPADVPALTRRARYTAGTLAADGRAVPGYTEEPGVEPSRGTETHAELLLQVDTPRWAGTTFLLRTGKALAAPRKGVVLHFRGAAPACDPEDAGPVSADRLWVELDGPRASARQPDRQVQAPGELSAYRQVLLDVLGGGRGTSVSRQEAELAWRVVDPVLRAWAGGAAPMLEYPAGSAGPAGLPAP